MQVQIQTNVADNLPVKDLNLLPFVYLPDYINFINKNYNANAILAIAPAENIFVLISIVKTKVLVNAQLLSVPFKGTEPLIDQKEFLDSLLETLQKEKTADRVIPSQNFVVFDAAPQNSSNCFFGSYVVDLTPTIEQLYSNVHSKHRNKISKAERAGVTVRSGASQVIVFYDLYKATMQRSNMYCEAKEYYESLFNQLGEENCYCAVVYHNDIPQGAMLSPCTKFCCYYVYGASSDNITESGSINYLHWHTIKEMKSRGVLRYDFVGARLSDVSNSKLEGIQSFKERFGGTLQKGYLWKADLNAAKCKLYESALSIKNKLTGATTYKDIIDQEIEKANS